MSVQERETTKIDFSVEKLDGTNWAPWKWHIKNVLREKKLLDAIRGLAAPGSEMDMKALVIIGAALDRDNKRLVTGHDTANSVWKELEQIYENKTTFEKQDLLMRLHSLKIESGKVTEALAELKDITTKLANLGERISDDSQMSIIINGLPAEYESFTDSFKMLPSEHRTLEHLKSNILSKSLKKKEVKNEPEDTALLVAGKRFKKFNNQSSDKNTDRISNKQKTCYHCKKLGHIKRECYKLKKEKQGQTSKSDKQGDETETIFMANENIEGPRHELWVVDSGSSKHMTPHSHWFENYQKTTCPIMIGDGRSIKAVGKGDIVTESGTLKDVFHVPDLAANLFSVSAATKNGWEFRYHKNLVDIYRNDKMLLQGKLVGNYYTLSLRREDTNSALVATSLDEWHKRFSHASMDTIRRMARSNAIRGMSLGNSEADKCEYCALGKCKNSSHPSKLGPKATRPGLVLHFDTVGPMRTESLSGSKYFVLGKDEYSRCRMVAFVKSKSEVPDQIKKMIKSSELKTQNECIDVCTDNGTEYVNETLSSYFNEKGINHKLSSPYTPDQNGFIEREVRTVVEAARTVLLASKLGKELWTEAVNCVVYTLNRTLGSNSDKTPFEMFTGRIPDVGNFHIFGEGAIILDKKNLRTLDKFAPKGIWVQFVGYTNSYNTFRFYNENTKKVMTSCDVVFVKNKPNDANIRQTNEETTQSVSVGILTGDIDSPTVATTSKRVRFSDQVDGNTNEVPSAGEHITGGPNTDEEEDIVVEETEDLMNKIAKISLNYNSSFLHPKINIHPEAEKSVSRSESALMATIEAALDPVSYKEAMKREDADEWKKAMQEEMAALEKHEVYELVDPPEKANLVTNRWVLRQKRSPEGKILRYRARLVAKGFMQRYGIDFDETFAPVAAAMSIRLIFAMAAMRSLILTAFDVKTAFLYGNLDEEVYMQQPEGFTDGSKKVWRLLKSLYGLKQAPRQWFVRLTDFLKETGMRQCENDKCIFIKESPLVLLAVYVDDGLIASENAEDARSLINRMKKEFEIHDVLLDTYLGFQVQKNEDGTIKLHQKGYIEKILKKFNFEDSTPVPTPVTVERSKERGKPLSKTYPYREAIGSLLYASTTTRPDISFAVGKVSRNLNNPQEEDWTAVKRIFRYLNGTRGLGLTYGLGDAKFTAFCDSDFAGAQDKRSTSGRITFYGRSAITWKSEKQSLVTLSTTEAELVSLCSLAQELVVNRLLAIEMQAIQDIPTKLLCDNQSTITIVNNERSMQRTRHIGVRAAYPREQQSAGTIRIRHIATKRQLADVFTKPMPTTSFLNMRKIIMGMITILICMAIGTEAFLQSSPPVVWRTTDKHIAFGRYVTYRVHLAYNSPCPPMGHSQPDLSFRDFKTTCQNIYDEQWSNEMEHLVTISGDYATTRDKRFPMIAAGAGLLATTIYTNFINVYRTDKRIDNIREEVKGFRELMIASTTASKDAIDKLDENMRKIYDDNKTWMKNLLMGIQITSKLMKSGRYLSNLVEEFRETRQLSIKDFVRLTNLTELHEVKSEDTRINSVTKIDDFAVTIEFVAIFSSKTTKIYATDPFRIWTEVDRQPKMLQYKGPELIMHNEATDCIKGIVQTPSRIIMERCDTQGGRGNTIDKWEIIKTMASIEQIEQETQIKSTYDSMFVYCFPGNIEIGNFSYVCPPTVIMLRSIDQFKTKDQDYNPEIKEYNISYSLPKMNYYHGIYDPDTQTKQLLSLIKEKANLTKIIEKLENTNYEEKSKYTLYLWLLTLACIAGAIISYMGYIGIRKYFEQRKTKPKQTKQTQTQQIELHGCIE